MNLVWKQEQLSQGQLFDIGDIDVLRVTIVDELHSHLQVTYTVANRESRVHA